MATVNEIKHYELVLDADEVVVVIKALRGDPLNNEEKALLENVIRELPEVKV